LQKQQILLDNQYKKLTANRSDKSNTKQIIENRFDKSNTKQIIEKKGKDKDSFPTIIQAEKV
jgi:hypothetical protein